MATISITEKQRIVDILTQSFDNNKSANWAIKSDKIRVKRMCRLMAYALEICKHKMVFVYHKTGQGLCSTIILKVQNIHFPD